MKSIKTNQRIRLEINSKEREREREREREIPLIVENKNKKAIVKKKNLSSKYLSSLVIIGIKTKHIYI